MKAKPWDVRITEARERGSFTMEDLRTVWRWDTCACGQLDDRIPRTRLGVPIDSELSSRGVSFTMAVCDNKFDKAESLLHQIQQREQVVLAGVK